MTFGSPSASAVSGPGVACTMASRRPSGDHATPSFSIVMAALLVPCFGAMNSASVPSARTTMTPLSPLPMRPWKAMCVPSGDHTGDDPRLCSSPTRVVRPLATSMIQSCEYGRPSVGLLLTLYAIFAASGEKATSPTVRSL